MKKHERVPGEFVTSVTIEEAFISISIQLIHWAHDIAFTDAAFGENWAGETANRMASCAEILNVVYQRMARRTLEMSVDLPAGMVGVMSINPDYDENATPPSQGDEGGVRGEGRDVSSVDDFPW